MLHCSFLLLHASSQYAQASESEEIVVHSCIASSFLVFLMIEKKRVDVCIEDEDFGDFGDFHSADKLQKSLGNSHAHIEKEKTDMKRQEETYNNSLERGKAFLQVTDTHTRVSFPLTIGVNLSHQYCCSSHLLSLSLLS